MSLTSNAILVKPKITLIPPELKSDFLFKKGHKIAAIEEKEIIRNCREREFFLCVRQFI